MYKALVIIAALVLPACAGSKGSGSASTNRGYKTVTEALSVSPIGQTCEVVVQTPISRGRGGGLEGKYETEVLYFPAYTRGDINSDGQVNREDALLAVKKFFKPENFECAAAADVAGYPQTLVPDGFFTSQDVYIWNQFKNSGQITWQASLICGNNCTIINHMN